MSAHPSLLSPWYMLLACSTLSEAFQFYPTMTTQGDADANCLAEFGTNAASIDSRQSFTNAHDLCQQLNTTLGSTASSYSICCLGGNDLVPEGNWVWNDESDNTLLAQTWLHWNSGGLWASNEPDNGNGEDYACMTVGQGAGDHGLHDCSNDRQCYAICNDAPSVGFKTCTSTSDGSAATNSPLTVYYQKGTSLTSCALANANAPDTVFTCEMDLSTPPSVCSEPAHFVQINLLGRDDVCIQSIIENGNEYPMPPQRIGDDIIDSPNSEGYVVVLKRLYDLQSGSPVCTWAPDYESTSDTAANCASNTIADTQPLCQWSSQPRDIPTMAPYHAFLPWIPDQTNACDSAYDVCSDDFECDDDDCSVTCSSVGCRDATINCPINANCEVVCDGSYECAYATIYCPTNHQCTVKCLADRACRGTTINWPENGLGNLICEGGRRGDPCHGVTAPSAHVSMQSLLPFLKEDKSVKYESFWTLIIEVLIVIGIIANIVFLCFYVTRKRSEC